MKDGLSHDDGVNMTIQVINGETVVFSKHYAEGRLETWGRCAPEHAQAIDRALRASVSMRSAILEDKFFTLLAESGVPRGAGESFLSGLVEEDAVILRPAS